MLRFVQRRSTAPTAPSPALRSGFLRARRGAVAVEFAIVFPIFLVLVFGAIDIGRAIMVQHKLCEAARAGCRLYLVKDEITQDEARAMVDAVMSDAHLDGYTAEFTPSTPEGIRHLEPVTVSVSIPQDRVSWLNGGCFMPGNTLTGTCTMPGDTGEVH